MDLEALSHVKTKVHFTPNVLPLSLSLSVCLAFFFLIANCVMLSFDVYHMGDYHKVIIEGCYESILNDFIFPSAFLKECRTFMWVNQHWLCFTSVALPDLPQLWAMIRQLATSQHASANDGTRSKYNSIKKDFSREQPTLFYEYISELCVNIWTKWSVPTSNKMSGCQTLAE